MKRLLQMMSLQHKRFIVIVCYFHNRSIGDIMAVLSVVSPIILHTSLLKYCINLCDVCNGMAGYGCMQYITEPKSLAGLLSLPWNKTFGCKPSGFFENPG